MSESWFRRLLKPHHMEKIGFIAGQTTKACNQLIVGMTIQAVAEAFTLAKKAGVNLAGRYVVQMRMK